MASETGEVGEVGEVGLPDTLLAPEGAAPVPPRPTALFSEFMLLEEPFAAPVSLVLEDWELERGLNPTCFIHMSADCGGDDWRIVM
jgi:hypothetical protein